MLGFGATFPCLGLGTGIAQLGVEASRRRSPLALPAPSRDSPDDHAENERQKDDQEQRQMNRQRWRLGGERIERHARPLPVRHREQDEENGDRHQDQGLEKRADHGCAFILLRTRRRLTRVIRSRESPGDFEQRSCFSWI